MKKLVNVVDVEGEGLVALLGQRVTLFCMNYIYTGDLIGVNDHDVILKNAAIVYETGSLTTKEWKDAQALPNADAHYVRTAAVESYGVVK